jgi:hypothetical protein
MFLPNELAFFGTPKQGFNGDRFGRLLSGKCSHNTGGNHDVDGNLITICVRDLSRRMDQLFSLGHVSGATKNPQPVWRGMSQGWVPEKKAR